jgi:hypothetical protein
MLAGFGFIDEPGQLGGHGQRFIFLRADAGGQFDQLKRGDRVSFVAPDTFERDSDQRPRASHVRKASTTSTRRSTVKGSIKTTSARGCGFIKSDAEPVDYLFPQPGRFGRRARSQSD